MCDAIHDAEVDGGGGQCDVEGHAIVMRCKSLQICADLVADVTLRRGAVGADDGHVDEAVLHQVAAGVVRDHRMRHAMVEKFPGGE
jgi:hypothetical protein